MASAGIVEGMLTAPMESFAALAGFRHGFIGRVPGIDVALDRAEALARLDRCHQEARHALGLGDRPMLRAEQVHGARVFALEAGSSVSTEPVAGVDALITSRADVCLGIYVADCCAVYVVDSARRVIGLAHSGKKGTELGIAPAVIRAMSERFGSRAEDLTVQLSPCIRPPHYEIDFAAEIVAQCRAAGVLRVHDAGACTAEDPERYYSYRREKGRTGRMLAVLAV